MCAAKAAELRSSAHTEHAPQWATLLDTKGPEIRTAMLREQQNILLEQGQSIIVEAVGDSYTEFEGYKTDSETRIGVSYAKLCSSVSPGDRILVSDGTIAIQVDAMLSPTELRGMVLNTKELGQRKNVNLPGVKVELPVLTERDVRDLKEFACKHGVDYVAASFVQSADDVRFIRSVLDSGGGSAIKIISKIENQAGLDNFEDILKVTDGIMIARGDLGVPQSKVNMQSLRGFLGHSQSWLWRIDWRPAQEWSNMQSVVNTFWAAACRHGDTIQQGASGAKDDDHTVQPARQVCHLRDPDARVDDHISTPYTC